MTHRERLLNVLNYRPVDRGVYKDNPFSSMPQFVRFPVATRADFRRFWRERMQPDLAACLVPVSLSSP